MEKIKTLEANIRKIVPVIEVNGKTVPRDLGDINYPFDFEEE